MDNLTAFGRNVRHAAGNLRARIRGNSPRNSRRQLSPSHSLDPTSSHSLDLNEDVAQENVQSSYIQEDTGPEATTTYEPHTPYAPMQGVDLDDLDSITRWVSSSGTGDLSQLAGDFTLDPSRFTLNTPQAANYAAAGPSSGPSRDVGMDYGIPGGGYYPPPQPYGYHYPQEGDYAVPAPLPIPPPIQDPQAPQGGYDNPPNNGILAHYNTHITHTIWDNPNCDRVLKCHTRKALLKELKEYALLGEGQQWLTLVEQSRLLGLRDWTFQETGEALVSAFIEHWHPETNSFHFPFGEMTITLHDVQQILGLPINGMKISSEFSGLSEAQIRAITAHMFGWDLQDLSEQISKDGGINIVRLKAFLKDAIVNGGNQEAMASAYLLLLLGNTLFPDKSGNAVPHRLMHCLLNHGATSGFAWGAGALAFLYRQLGMATRIKASQISGCMYILHVWIWAYFPRWRGRLSRNVGPGPVTYEADASRHRNPESLKDIRRALDRMSPDELDWMPWRDATRFTEGDLALTWYRGLLTYFKVQEPYMPERCVRQMGYVQTIPRWGKVRNDNLRRYQYEIKFHTEDDHWNNRAMHLEPVGERAMFSYSAHPDYLPWFKTHCHPYLLSASADAMEDQQAPAPSPVDIYAQMSYIQGVVRHYQEYRNLGGWGADLLSDIEAGLTSRPPPVPPNWRPRRPTSAFQPPRHSDAGFYN